jgi:PiT family inorganic phosphate transporter
MELALVFTVIFTALAFNYTNGFHDTANAIATVVGTKVLSPRQAILASWASVRGLRSFRAFRA